jgi:hypothetical protein
MPNIKDSFQITQYRVLTYVLALECQTTHKLPKKNLQSNQNKSTIQQCFSTILCAMAYQPNDQGGKGKGYYFYLRTANANQIETRM